MADAWDPGQYERFRAEREQPFRDLLALVMRRPAMRVVDLGCGPGVNTLVLHRELQAMETLGLDASAAMLARVPTAKGLHFECGEIAKFAPAAPFDLVFSNAALHWVPDHAALLKRLSAALAPGGQLAVQMPMNDAHPSHQTAFELARSAAFRTQLGGFERRPPLFDPERYASWLHKLGFERQHVRVQVYGHLLEDREQVVEWTRGALLTEYQARLSPDAWQQFLTRYRELLLPQLEDDRPYFYTYPRILFWGALPEKGAGAS